MDKDAYLRSIERLRENLERNYRQLRRTRDGICFFSGILFFLLLMPFLGMVKF